MAILLIAILLLVLPSLNGGSQLVFTRQRYIGTIYENNVGKSYVTPEGERMGIQLDLNSQTEGLPDIRYRIVSGDKNRLFKAESRLVGDFSFLLLRTRTGQVDVLNRERADLHKLRVRATLRSPVDGSDSDLLDAEADVWVHVLDTNDLSPMFYPSEYEANVPEDAPLHTSLLAVKADDADLGINGQIYYSLAEPSDIFAVHPLTGVVSLTRRLIFAQQPYHELSVVARDRGPQLTAAVVSAAAASTARVRIHVTRVNQHEPQIHIRHLPQVIEQSQVDVYAVVRVEDADQGASGTIRSLDIIDGDPDGYFRVQKVGDEYNIAVLKLLDRERSPWGYNLTLRAVDNGTPARNTTASLHVRVTDWNDHAPVFERQHYDVQVMETAPINTPIGRLRVSDEDQGRNAQVQLSIAGGNQGGHFRINANTGVLYTAQTLDAELRTEHVLTVSAVDQGTSGTRKQSSAKVTIRVLDANDNDPVFQISQLEKNRIQIQVEENEPAGVEVAKTVARDADAGENGYISYSLANLTPVPFQVDPFTGAVRTTESLDYETGPRRYLLKIRASDWGSPYRRQSELQVAISVKDVNDNRPQFERVACSGRVPRWTSIGSELLTLSAVDFDRGNVVSYRIVSGNEDGCFSLDAASGALGVACDLNDLGISERIINVTATDGQHFADISSVRVHLTGTRSELTAASSATTADVKFECKETGVGKRLVEMVNSAAKNQLNDEDSDDPLPSRYGQNVHTPEFYDFPAQVRVNESVAAGTALVRLRARDRDHGYNGLLVYVISSGDELDSAFQLDTDTGLLRVGGQLDRERRASYSLNVSVLDLGQPQRSAWRILPIVVTDVNDNPPRFDRPVISVSIAETTAAGTSVAQLSASDADEGDNAKITYHLIQQSDAVDFQLDSSSGLLSVAAAAQLDRERKDSYELAIEARDSGTLTSRALVRVRILDVNDVAPRFAQKNQVVRIREDLPVGAVIALVDASDPDLGAGGQVRYSLSSSMTGYASSGSVTVEGIESSSERFSIDRMTGTVRLARRLDFEERQLYNLTIVARDRGSPSLSSQASLAVEVVDVNENLYAPRFDDFAVECSVKENSPLGSLVTKLQATDADPPGDDSRVTYSIRSGTGLGLFSIDSQGAIRTRAVLDRESQANYWLTVVAQDHGIVSLSTSIDVFVEVLDENDHTPLTTEPVYWVSVAENSPPRTAVARITSFDGDNTNAKLMYHLKAGNPQSLFDIDANTGNITTTGRRLDRENQNEHILEVVVTDSGSVPPLSSSTRVVVTVEDVNDNSPEFLERFYKIQIPNTHLIDHHNHQSFQNETEEDKWLDPESNSTNVWITSRLDNLLGSPVFRVEAFDRDAGDNGKVCYSLMETAGSKGRFRIHPHSGAVYAQKSLTAGQEFSFAVRASDRGRPARNTTARVSVAVIGVPTESAHPPQLGADNSRRADVMESDPVGHAVAFITAHDPDGDMLWYKIEDGNVGDKFAMQTTGNGKVYVAQPLDWEEKAFYSLNISITDGVNTIYTLLDITVLDVNDHPPIFTRQLYTSQVSENAEIGTEIAQLNATDADEDKRVFYSLHAASSAVSMRKFKVDSLRGVVTLAEKLDRETMSQHVLTVSVKDQGTPSKRNFARLVIDVLDHNDHPPEFLSELVQVRIFETASIGSTVTQMLAVDKDRGVNARVSYSISAGNVGGAFLIDPDSGFVRVNQLLDVSTAHEYMLVVKASDNGSPSLSATCRLHILVVMAENDPPKFANQEYTADVFEDAVGGTFVIQIEGRSVSSLLFEIVAGNEEDDAFGINPSTGTVVVSQRFGSQPLDYERIKNYNLTINAMNMAGASAKCRLLIHVLDVNDNVPSFSQSIYHGMIVESAPAQSLVTRRLISTSTASPPLVVSASDADSGVNALLTYEIVEPWAGRLFAIDSNTGALRTLAVLDRERSARLEFTVVVTDQGRPKLQADQAARVIVDVLDINDSPPVFTGPLPYTATLLLPTYEGVTVVALTATDPDTDINSTLIYSITAGNKEGAFTVDPLTGRISVKDASALAGPNSYYALEVVVSDGKHKASTSVEVALEKMSASGLAFAQDKYSGFVTENSAQVVTIATLNVLGTLLNEHVTFSILNPQLEGAFQVGITSGVVQTTGLAVFDRETQSRYVVVVEARSERGEGEKPRVAHTRVEVDVLDVNDNRPLFVNLPYYAVVSLEAPKGSVVTKVQAIDKDIGENGDIRYELIRGSGELFRVDRRTGEILLRQPLEGHHSIQQQQLADYELIIAAFDGASPPLSSETVVRVKTVDKNQPVFGQQYYSATISESADPLSPVLSVQASSPSGRQLIYAIVSGNEGEEFAVDFNTGLIYIVNRLDYELRSKYELQVRATDGVSGVLSEVTVSINVEDANDSPPEFTLLEYNVTLSEATPYGATVLSVQAIDHDSNLNAQVTYRLLAESGSGGDFFSINSEQGSILLTRSLDREMQSQHHLLVMASDRGTPSLTSTAHIWIRVDDVNDNPPKFESRSYRCVLSEDAKRGQFVGKVTGTDPDVSDQSKLVYSLTGGNDQQIFHMDAKRGTVTLANLHRFAEQSVYLLNVSVSDGVFTNFATLQVDLLSTNRHAPLFNRPLYEVEVMENLPAGTFVFQLNASDADRDDYGRILYSIPSSAALQVFSIDEESGEVVTRRPLDRESRRIYELPVMASDAGGKTGHATLKIRVGDANDNRPRFLLAAYRANIHANFSVGQPFLRVQAVDADLDDNSRIVYSIYESNGTRASDIFDINPTSGDLFLKKSSLSLANEVFQFFVRAEDSGLPQPLGNEAPVDVLILEPQERAPSFERTSSKYFISEAAPVGTTIARVKATSSGQGEPLRYSIVPGGDDEDDEPSPFFSVDNEGHIYLSAPLDRETSDTHIITVLASTEASPPVIASTEVIIQVLDVNEHPPEFESNPYHVLVAENAEKGTSIIRVAASDGDRISGTYGDLRYAFGSAMPPELANVFRLDSVTGWITLLGPLDREETDRYTLPVTASDNGSPAKLSSATAVVIEVRDYNDNAPQFSQSHYVAAVNEEALAGTVVVRLTTTDRDYNPSSTAVQQPQLQFYIVSGDPRAQFGIRMGEIYVQRPLDREEIGSYNIQVLATDGFFTATTHVTIDILDDNDNPPYCTQHRYHELVSESTLPGAFIVRVRATDADEGSNAKMKFYLTGESADYFTLDPASGQLKTAKLLDREQTPIYSLTAHVQDREKPQWECTSEIEIVLMDVNDNAPQFGQDWYTFSIPEDAEVRTIVGKIHATDADLGANRKVRYAVKQTNPHQHFAVDAESGIVTVAKSLDRETTAFYNVTVTASDLGTPSLSSTVVITITILDVNDNPPLFGRKLYAASVAEDSPLGHQIVRVMATSLDVGVNAEIKYSIVGGNEHRHFSIDPSTGFITLTEALDYERAREFYLTIQALDGGHPPLSNHAAVNITVLDSNDNAPVFSQAGGYSAAVREDAANGETILVINAVDLDSGENGRITYSLVNGDRHGQLRVDSQTGALTVAGQLDREMISSYTLEVEARDNGSPTPLTATTLVALEISDANDNPPAFSQPNYTAIAQEDKQLGFAILKLQVTDADGPNNAGPFTFEIRTGNVDNAFRIDADGTLRTATIFNHKVRDNYSLQVVCFDNGSPPLFSDTWIAVRVIEESKYPPIVTPLEIAVHTALDEFAGGVLGRVHATDQDPYDTLVFSLAAPPKSAQQQQHQSIVGLFDLDAEDGTLIARPGLDVGSYSVNVSVNDSKFVTYAAVKVNVIHVPEEAVQNAIVLTIREMSPDDFVNSYRKSLLKAVRSVMAVRAKDIFIISIQPQINNNRTKRNDVSPAGAAITRIEPMWRVRDPNRQLRPNLDVLLAVQKTPGGGYYPPAVLRKQLIDNQPEMESTLGHRMAIPTQGTCGSTATSMCGANGKCYDRVVLDDTMTTTVTNDINSFVAPRHSYQPTCLCKEGFGGQNCDVVTNECSRNPCSLEPETVCRADPHSAAGYSCICPEGNAKCLDNNQPTSYRPRHPLSMTGGKSYAQYSVGQTLERHFVVKLSLRSFQPTSTILYTAGRVDHASLELVDGRIQFRFDCGSGETVVRAAASGPINDGNWHDVRLERHGNVAELTVDGIHRSQASTPGLNDQLNLELNNNDVNLFLGAEVRHSDDVRLGFVGCLDDVRLNDIPLPLHIVSTASSINSLGGQQQSNGHASLKRLVNVEFNCRSTLESVGNCGSQPCLNGGTCTELLTGAFSCQCRSRFVGSRCELDSDPCASSPCLYNGRCFNVGGGDFRCECAGQRLTGKRCEYGRYCSPNPCKNGGLCEEGANGPACKCRGFTGDLCSVDVNECEPSPCRNGGTCVNIVGSFQCLCPVNATGHYCTEPALRNDLIISAGRYGVTLEQLVCIVVGITVILLIILTIFICRRIKAKRRHRRHRPGSLTNLDSNGKELVPLNSTRNGHGHNGDHGHLPEYKRGSKMSNLEVSQGNGVPMLPPRPASYTPSSEPTYIPLNNLDTIRSYGSAADELETYPMLGLPSFASATVSSSGHNNPDYHPNLNRSTGHAGSPLTTGLPSPPLLLPSHDALSDTDSLHKPCWSDLETNLKGSYYESAKIHNDLKGKVSSSDVAGSSARSHYGVTGGGILLNNVKSTNKDPVLTPPVDDCAQTSPSAVRLRQHHNSNSIPSPLPTPPPTPPVIPPLPRDYAEFELSLQELMIQTALLTRPLRAAARARHDKAKNQSTSYHWDCSDWAHQSTNPLPNITEVPGSEIPDTSSFHSNESNESNGSNSNNRNPINGSINPERDLDTLVEDHPPPRQAASVAMMMNNGLMAAALDSDCGGANSDVEMSSSNPFRNDAQQHHRQPPSFEQILAQSGLRLSDLAIVSLPQSDGAGSDSDAPSDSLPPPGNYSRHPNLYLPPYSIADDTEAEGNGSTINGEDPDYSEVPDDDDDDESPPSSTSSFASQIHRPLVNLRNGNIGAAGSTTVPGASNTERISTVSMDSYSDVSNNLCDIDDSEFEVDDVARTQLNTTVKKPGQPIQTDV